MKPERLRLILLIAAGVLILFNLYMYLTMPETPVP
jgi:hypothetical protein